jgi:hypothetical protein
MPQRNCYRTISDGRLNRSAATEQRRPQRNRARTIVVRLFLRGVSAILGFHFVTFGCRRLGRFGRAMLRVFGFPGRSPFTHRSFPALGSFGGFG